MRNMTARDLAMRDPALAAMIGALPGADFGVDFGYAPQFGDEQAAAAWAAQQRATQGREHLIAPNQHSAVKIQRYTYALNVTIAALATPEAGLRASNAPQVNFRPQRVGLNTPAVGFAYITALQVANVNVLVGGKLDGHQFGFEAVGSDLDLPTLSPSNQASVTIDYTGTVPLPLEGTGEYELALSFTGPATLTA